MTIAARPPPLRVAVARVRQHISVPGLVGSALIAFALLKMALDWKAHEAFRTSASIDRAEPAAVQELRTVAPRRVSLPSAEDVPVFLTRVQRTALEQGLGWPRADYRFQPATNDTPASVEVLCTLKGPYPNVRRFVTALLQGMPTLTLRDFNLNRPSAAVPDVEAKFAIVFYVSSEEAR